MGIEHVVPDRTAGAIGHLHRYGVAVTVDAAGVDGTADGATLTVGDGPASTVPPSLAHLVYLPKVTATTALRAVADRGAGQAIVIGPWIADRTADVLRGAGLWYADAAGNAYVRAPGLVIDVRGRRPENPARAPRSAEFERTGRGATVNVFSPKRAQVAMALLTEPDLAGVPYREIAVCSGVSVGMATDAIGALTAAGFVEQAGGRRRLIRANRLLEAWAAAYGEGLRRSTRMLVAAGDIAHWRAPEALSVAVSGESAVPSIIRNPGTLTLYVSASGKSVPTRLMLDNRWRSDPQGPIVIHRRFWGDLPSFGPDGTGAPAPLIYGDLLASQEARQIAAAHELRESDARLGRL